MTTHIANAGSFCLCTAFPGHIVAPPGLTPSSCCPTLVLSLPTPRGWSQPLLLSVKPLAGVWRLLPAPTSHPHKSQGSLATSSLLLVHSPHLKALSPAGVMGGGAQRRHSEGHKRNGEDQAKRKAGIECSFQEPLSSGLNMASSFTAIKPNFYLY